MNAGTFGIVVTMPLSGVLSSSEIGWPSVFYIFGLFGIAWSFLFFYFGADMPSEHPTICPNEMRYIETSLGRLEKTLESEVRFLVFKELLFILNFIENLLLLVFTLIMLNCLY
jgi:MFS family permease